jgi:hypothetical protein
MLGMCYILFMCVCVGASGSTTASDDLSSSALCVVCVGLFPRGVPGGGRYAPPGYVQHPKIVFWAVFAIFSGLLN